MSPDHLGIGRFCSFVPFHLFRFPTSHTPQHSPHFVLNRIQPSVFLVFHFSSFKVVTIIIGRGQFAAHECLRHDFFCCPGSYTYRTSYEAVIRIICLGATVLFNNTSRWATFENGFIQKRSETLSGDARSVWPGQLHKMVFFCFYYTYIQQVRQHFHTKNNYTFVIADGYDLCSMGIFNIRLKTATIKTIVHWSNMYNRCLFAWIIIWQIRPWDREASIIQLVAIY